MVGIAFSNSKEELEIMLDSMDHFPWHIRDTCKNINAGIIRLDSLENFKFENSDYSVLLDGYIYNYSLEEITIKYKKIGKAIFENLDGEFTLILHSKSEESTYIVNDPFGLRRCYYSLNDNNLLVATESKAIAKIVKSTFDQSTIYSMIRFRRVFSDRTFFENIRRLMPGHIIEYKKNDKIKIRKYYQYEYKPKQQDELEIATKTAKLFKNALNKRMLSNKRNAIALSGGLDSRSMAILSKEKKVSTFTYGSGKDPDSIIAKGIARKLGLPHTLITFDCTNKKIANLAEFASYLTEGLTTIAFCFQLYVFGKIFGKYDVYFWTFELDDTLGGNLLGQVSDESDYQKYSTIDLMMRRSIFNESECKKLFTLDDKAPEIIEEHYRFVETKDTKPAFELAQLIDLLQRGTTGHFIARNFIEEKIPTFDREFIDHIQQITLELKANHYIYFKFLSNIDPDLFKIKSATTGLGPQPNRLEKFWVRNKARFEKIKQRYFKIQTKEKNYFDVDLAMSSQPWIDKFKEHALLSSAVKKYINVDYANDILQNHIKKKENNGTKLFAILTVAIALNIFSNEKSEKNSKKFLMDLLKNENNME